MPKRPHQVVTTLNASELTALDEFKDDEDLSRADAIRVLIRLGLDRHSRSKRAVRR